MKLSDMWQEIKFPPINLYNLPVQNVFKQAELLGNPNVPLEHVQKVLYGDK